MLLVRTHHANLCELKAELNILSYYVEIVVDRPTSKLNDAYDDITIFTKDNLN